MMKRISDNQAENTDKADRSGVYKINCGQCDIVYIRETGRKLGTWMKEHSQFRAKRNDKLLCLENAAMRKDTLTKQQDRNVKHFTQRILPPGENSRNSRKW